MINKGLTASIYFLVPSLFIVSVLLLNPVSAVAATTAILFPNGQGTYTAWVGDEGDIDETGTPDCEDNNADGDDNVAESTGTGDRESVLIDLSSIFNGSTITSVDVLVTYRNGNDVGADDGTFQTFARLNGTDLDSGVNLIATNTTCTVGTHTLNVTDTVKSGATTLEVGVLKTGADTSEVWVGTIRTIVTYTPITYTITSSAGAGGTITPNGATVVTGGDDQSFDGTPNATFILADVLVDAVSVGRANFYQFNNVAADHTIAASFDGGWSAPKGFVDGDNDVGDDAEAFTSNNLSTDLDDDNDEIDFTNFDFYIPSGATIDGIEVALEGSREENRSLGVLLSWNGGANFTATSTLNFAEDETTIVLGNSSDLWGHAWTASEFSNANFRMRVATGNQSDDVNLDQLQVKIHYTPPPGVLVVKKILINDNGGTVATSTFSFQVNGASTTPFNTQGEVMMSLASSTYSIVELATVGYATIYSNSNNGSSNCTNLAVTSNATTTCTITNDDIAPTLTLVKVVVNDSGGTATISDFDLFFFDPVANSFSQRLSGEKVTLNQAGTYDLSENGPVGYTASNWVCVGGNQTDDDTVEIDLGENVICTITNDDQPGTLVVQKVLVNNNGGNNATTTFTFQVNAGGSQAFEADGENILTVDAGIYSVVEDVVAGYATTYSNSVNGNPDCSSLPVGNGETVTCTILNDDIPPPCEPASPGSITIIICNSGVIKNTTEAESSTGGNTAGGSVGGNGGRGGDISSIGNFSNGGSSSGNGGAGGKGGAGGFVETGNANASVRTVNDANNSDVDSGAPSDMNSSSITILIDNLGVSGCRCNGNAIENNTYARARTGENVAEGSTGGDGGNAGNIEAGSANNNNGGASSGSGGVGGSGNTGGTVRTGNASSVSDTLNKLNTTRVRVGS